jgi:hypothetical protein
VLGGFARSVSLARDGSRCVMACDDGRVLLRELTAMFDDQPPRLLGRHAARAAACALSPAASRALSVGADGRLCLWSLRQGTTHYTSLSLSLYLFSLYAIVD